MSKDISSGETSKIYFGKVMDVKDDKYIFRVRVAIPGYTDKLAVEDLPLYFPWYGVNFLPLVNDIVPVRIFDNNFVNGFYGRKIDCINRELEESDYEHYLEIYKRLVNDKNVQLTYTPSLGIQFINDTSNVQIEQEQVSVFVESVDKMSIVMTADSITIGEPGAQQMSLLGDEVVEYLQNIQREFSKSILKELSSFAQGLQTAAGGNPYTANLVAPCAQAYVKTSVLNSDKIMSFDYGKLQSKKVSNS